MGMYLDSQIAYSLYKSEVQKPYFIDKTKMLEELLPLVSGGNNFICITRPRRFGKTTAASMIGAFFSDAKDSADIFDSLAIAKAAEYQKYRNQSHVIYIDFSEMDDACDSYEGYI